MAKTPQEARALLLAACQSANRYVHVDRETLILACTEDDAPRAQTRAALRVLPKQAATTAPPKPKAPPAAPPKPEALEPPGDRAVTAEADPSPAKPAIEPSAVSDQQSTES